MNNKNLGAKLNTLLGKQKRKRVINPKEIRFDLKDELPQFFTAFHKAVPLFHDEMCLTNPEDRARGYEATTFNSKLSQCLREEFGVSLRKAKYGRHLVYLKGYIVLFKKLDKHNRPMNVPTKNSESIGNQIQGNLFNCEDDGTAPIIFFGYSQNKFGEYTNPRFVYIDEDQVKWIINEQQVVSDAKPATDLFNSQPSAGVRIKPGVKVAKRKAE
jgi:hypothetical protein